MPNTEETIIAAALAEVRKVVQAFEQSLTKQLRMARGTQPNLSEESGMAMEKFAEEEEDAVPTLVSLPQQIENLLRTGPKFTTDLAKLTETPKEEIQELLQRLQHEQKIYNMGTVNMPRWSWLIGDETETKELNQMIEVLLRDTPLTAQELVHATGARIGRIYGGIGELKKHHSAGTLDGQIQDLNLPFATKGPHQERLFILPGVAKNKIEKRTKKTDQLHALVKGPGFDLDMAVMEMYGEDTKASRNKLRALLTYLEQEGRLARTASGRWKAK